MPIVIIPVGWMVECLGSDPNSPTRSVFPGIYILKFWQGIVDIVLRAITLVRMHAVLNRTLHEVLSVKYDI